MARRSVPSSLLLVALAAALPAGAGPAAVRAGLEERITVELPPNKAGGRALRHSLGKLPEATAAEAVASGVAGTGLVDEDRAVEEGSRLRVTIERAGTRPEDRSAFGALTSGVDVDVVAAWQWSRGGEALASGRFEETLRHEVEGRLTAWDITEGWRELLAELGRSAAFAGADSGVFGAGLEGEARTSSRSAGPPE